MPDLSILPPVSEPNPQTTVGSGFELVEVLEQALDDRPSTTGVRAARWPP